MRTYWLILVLASSSAFGEPCPTYRPAEKMSWNAYSDYYNGVIDGFKAGQDIRPLFADWQKALDSEMTPALYTIFTRPESSVSYSAFSDMQFRYVHGPDGKPLLNAAGEPYAASTDGGLGLRVVWQLTQNIRNVPRLLSVISFWRFNFQTGVPELVPGQDALRIRSQLTDFVPHPEDEHPGPGQSTQDVGQGFAGVSFTSTVAMDGKIVGLIPSPPIGLAPYQGDPAQHPNVSGIALPMACASCHRGHLNRQAAHAANPLYQEKQRKAFVAYVREHGLSAEKAQALDDKMQNPEATRALFTPAGLLPTLEGKCRQ